MIRIIYFVTSLYLECLFFYLAFFLKTHLIFRAVSKPRLTIFLLAIFFLGLAPPRLECQLVHQLNLLYNHKLGIKLELQEAIANFLVLKQPLHLWMNEFFLLKISRILSRRVSFVFGRDQVRVRCLTFLSKCLDGPTASGRLSELILLCGRGFDSQLSLIELYNIFSFRVFKRDSS